MEPKRLMAVRTVGEQARFVPNLGRKLQTRGLIGRMLGRPIAKKNHPSRSPLRTSCYADIGITGVMPHPVICRTACVLPRFLGVNHGLDAA